MPFELFDFGENTRVQASHLCSSSCGDPCQIFREIQEMETKIADMKQALESTLYSYRVLRNRMNILHDPFVRRVPLEIATTIFRLCLPVYRITSIYYPEILDDDEGCMYNRQLFTLGAVCKSWRQIVWSTPQFWSRLSICLNSTNVSTSIDIAKDWLERSQRLPLSIQVYFSTPYDDEDLDEELVEEVKSLGKAINAYSSRWESLDLRLPPILFSMFHGEPSNLRELRILNYEPLYHAHACILSTEGGNKPAPSYVAFNFVPWKALDICWSNVTRIDTRGIDVQECVELLHEVPQLTQCRFAMIGPPRSAWVGSRHVHHALTDLQITIPYIGGMDDECLDHLTFPSLQDLTIRLHGSVPTQKLLLLLERSSCKLRKLFISGEFEEEALVSMLKHIPSLSSLTLASTMLEPALGYEPFIGEGLFELLASTSKLLRYEDNHTNGQLSSIQTSAEGGQEQENPIPSPNQEVFLPELKEFKYETHRSYECNVIWHLIPAAFGYPARKSVAFDVDPPPLRPLRSVVVSLSPPSWGDGTSLVRPQYINPSTLLKMKELVVECGCKIETWVTLMEDTEPEDHIANSVAWHRREKRCLSMTTRS